MLRQVRFQPYAKGQGPTFTLSLLNDDKFHDNRYWPRYQLRMKPVIGPSVILFDNDDVGSSPLHATDSDAMLKAIMTFLTMRPGDTDLDYFEGYTQDQLDYCDQHAGALSIAVFDRFGE